MSASPPPNVNPYASPTSEDRPAENETALRAREQVLRYEYFGGLALAVLLGASGVVLIALTPIINWSGPGDFDEYLRLLVGAAGVMSLMLGVLSLLIALRAVLARAWLLLRKVRRKKT